MADTILSVSGVYAIRHIKSGRAYIGSSVDMLMRWRGHQARLRSEIHHCQFLQRAWLKHGEDAFAVECIEVIQDISLLLIREQHWIDVTRRTAGGHYNVCQTAGSTLGRLHSEESKAKLKAMRSTPEARAANRARQLGRKSSPEKLAKHRLTLQTPECKARLRAAHLGRKATPAAIEAIRASQIGRRHSDETKEKMRLSSLGKTHTTETKLRISNLKKGKRMSPRTPEEKVALREKLSSLRKGRIFPESAKIILREKALTRNPITEETRAKISAYHKGRKHSPEHVTKVMASCAITRASKREAMDHIYDDPLTKVRNAP